MKSQILSFFLISIIIFSCDKEKLAELNINPQAPDKIDMNLLFTSAELGTASYGTVGDNRRFDQSTNVAMCAHAIQQVASTGAAAPGDKYNQDAFETITSPWEFAYKDVLQNLNEILRQTGKGGFDEGKKKNLREAARILRVFNFMRLTDFYGNIPYENALNGVSSGVFFPTYTNQKDIYSDLLKELSEATIAISSSNVDDGFSKSDLLFDGKIENWKKFGNSLMLRIAMRISNVDLAKSNEYVTKAVSGGLMSSNSDIAFIKMAIGPNQWVNQNGISRAFTFGDGGQQSVLSKTFVDFLKLNNDPRLMIISGGVGGKDMDPANQKGCPNGLDATTLDKYLDKKGSNIMFEFSVLNPKLLDLDENYVFMNYSEVEYLLAEAAERKIGGVTDAGGHFSKGLKASIQQYWHYDPSFNINDKAALVFVDANPYKGGTDGLEQIGTQLWASKFLIWWDAWADWRRTGYPKLIPVNYLGNITNGTIPRKLRVPPGELATNQKNFLAGGSQPNEYTTRVWWDSGK